MNDIIKQVIDFLDSAPLNKTYSTNELAFAIKRNKNTLRKFTQADELKGYISSKGQGVPLIWHNKESQTIPSEIIDLCDLQRLTISKLELENKRLRMRLVSRQEGARIVAGSIKPLIPPKPPKSSSKKNSKKPKATLGIVLTDWHIGERVDPKQMGNLNAYNWDIAKQGIFSIVHRMLNWVGVQRHGYDINELVIWSLGDIIGSTSIHGELSKYGEFPTTVATAKAGTLLGEVYNMLSKHFAKVRIVQVAGNHDRLTKEQPYKNVNHDSVAYLSYVIAESLLSNHKHVSISTPEDPIPIIEVEGHAIACMHGHQIKSTGISPYYGITRRINAMLRERADLGETKLLTTLMGHFHHHAILEDAQAILCPALIGPTEWSRQMGFRGKPGQLAFLISKRGVHGMTVFDREVK